MWEDPWKKPCYLFALVAGDLAVEKSTFKTMTGRTVRPPPPPLLSPHTTHHTRPSSSHPGMGCACATSLFCEQVRLHRAIWDVVM